MSSYTSKVIAVLGRTLRAGRWKLADDTLVIALFGRCVLDLTRAYVDEDDDDLTMSVFAVFGSVSILLPPGCDVEPSGVAIVASSSIEIPSERPADITKTSLAPLDISWLAMFAKVSVAEVRPDGSELPHGAAAAALDPPAVDVFGGAEGVAALEAPTPVAESAPEPSADPEPVTGDTVEPFSDPVSEAAALRDEIAQWRAESGRRATDDETAHDVPSLSPEDEIIDEEDDHVTDAGGLADDVPTS